MGQTIITSAIDIDAPIETVWAHLTETDQYAAWNPFIVEVRADGPATTPGRLLRFRVEWPGGGSARSKERVVSAQPPTTGSDGMSRAEWIYDFTGFLAAIGCVRARRIQRLTQLPGGPTRYESAETFSGVFSRFVPFDDIQAGFDAQTRALKAVSEEASTPQDSE